MPCDWIYYPSTRRPPEELALIVDIFNKRFDQICSPEHTCASNEVLGIVRDDLVANGFLVEKGKKKEEHIEVPVLFGARGEIEKSFLADAFLEEKGVVLEVEAGRATVNYQFLKDFFEACMMQDARYLVIAVRRVYEGGGMNSKDFEKVKVFFKTLYASDRLEIPLEGIMVIGY